MIPYNLIENQKNVINKLKLKLKHSKNQVKDAEDINVLVDTVNAFESMLTRKYYTEAIELLLWSRMYDHFSRAEVFNGKPIPLYDFNEWLKRDFNMGATVIKSELKDILKSHELSIKLKDDIKDWDWIDWDEILNKTMTELKQCIKWKELT